MAIEYLLARQAALAEQQRKPRPEVEGGFDRSACVSQTLEGMLKGPLEYPGDVFWFKPYIEQASLVKHPEKLLPGKSSQLKLVRFDIKRSIRAELQDIITSGYPRSSMSYPRRFPHLNIEPLELSDTKRQRLEDLKQVEGYTVSNQYKEAYTLAKKAYITDWKERFLDKAAEVLAIHESDRSTILPEFLEKFSHNSKQRKQEVSGLVAFLEMFGSLQENTQFGFFTEDRRHVKNYTNDVMGFMRRLRRRIEPEEGRADITLNRYLSHVTTCQGIPHGARKRLADLHEAYNEFDELKLPKDHLGKVSFQGGLLPASQTKFLLHPYAIDQKTRADFLAQTGISEEFLHQLDGALGERASRDKETSAAITALFLYKKGVFDPSSDLFGLVLQDLLPTIPHAVHAVIQDEVARLKQINKKKRDVV